MIDSGSALLILRKWADETTLLLFRFESTEIACAMGGTISEGSDSEWVVRSRRGDATLNFDLEECVFEYKERRAFGRDEDSPEEAAEKGHLLIFLPPRFSSSGIPDVRSSLTVSELLPSEIKEGY